jgi:hypothetical protein
VDGRAGKATRLICFITPRDLFVYRTIWHIESAAAYRIFPLPLLYRRRISKQCTCTVYTSRRIGQRTVTSVRRLVLKYLGSSSSSSNNNEKKGVCACVIEKTVVSIAQLLGAIT